MSWVPHSVAPRQTHSGGDDAFVAEVNAAGMGLVYCGFIGGAGIDFGDGIAVDKDGNAYVTGYTESAEGSFLGFPVLTGPDLSYNGGGDVFVAKVNADGSDLTYCGYIGGSGYDWANGAAVDAGGNVYITGETASFQTTFPVTVGPDLTFNGSNDAFAAKIAGTSKDDLVGTWDGQGVYFRNSETGAWTDLTSPADVIACGDLYRDGADDLIGIWSGQAWVKNSADGSWSYLAYATRDVAAGDMNGDGRVDFVGTWDGQGVYYKDSISGAWVQMTSPAEKIAAGDLDGDGKADLIGVWTGQGLWVKYSKTGAWGCISYIAPRDFAVGDMNGDGRVDFVGTWDGQGVYYKDSVSGAWVQMTSPADQAAAGDLDGDGVDDLIGNWSGQGLWVKYSKTLTWAQITSAARDIAAGKLSGAAWSSGLGSLVKSTGPAGGL